MTIWDYDKVGSDDIIGTIRLHWKDIMDKKYEDYCWMNIYGAPLKVSGDYTDDMNEEPRIASNWRGRILCSLAAAKLKKPKSSIESIEGLIGDEIRDKFGPENSDYPNYELRAKVYSGNALPFPEEDYSIVVSWGDKEIESSKVESKNGLCEWYEPLAWTMVKFPHDHSLEFPPPNVIPDDIPDIFVYLVMDGKKICFKRLDPK